VFGCGTLTVQTASDAGTVTLLDVPEVEQVHQTVAELLFQPSTQYWPEPQS
jgi:membrane protein YdbS with pleckstrin-like domain